MPALAVCLLLTGSILLYASWRGAAEQDAVRQQRAALLGELGTALVIGFIVTLAGVYVQDQIASLNAAQAEEAAWRANVAVADSIPGFDPHGHRLTGLNLSSKDLRGADMDGVDLRGIQMRDADLRGANLRGADLRRAHLDGSDLSTAELAGAYLAGASLRGTRFDKAAIEHAKSLRGAEANVRTCWPNGFLALDLADGIKPVPWDDGDGNRKIGPGKEDEDCTR